MNVEEMYHRGKNRALPKFYPGSILRVTYKETRTRTNKRKIVGICTSIVNRGLGSNFTIRNTLDGASFDMCAEYTHIARLFFLSLCLTLCLSVFCLLMCVCVCVCACLPPRGSPVFRLQPRALAKPPVVTCCRATPIRGVAHRRLTVHSPSGCPCAACHAANAACRALACCPPPRRTFQFYNPLIESIDVLEYARRRRAKLYYLKGRNQKESTYSMNHEQEEVRPRNPRIDQPGLKRKK